MTTTHSKPDSNAVPNKIAGHLDASLIGGPRGFSAQVWAEQKAAEAQSRMDARAAAGIPEPSRATDPAMHLKRALDAAIPFAWRGMTLDQFRAYSPELAEIANAVGEFIEYPRGILYLHGGVGCGKTHLAAGAAIRLVERGYPVRAYRTTDVATKLRDAVRQNDLETQKDRLKNTRVLVLDDFGAEHLTDWLAAEWYDILDYRYGQFAATIITSNMPPDGLDMPRLTSRFSDRQRAQVIGIAGSDYRTFTRHPAGSRPMAAAFAPEAYAIPQCETCGGSGMVRLEYPVGHPSFGKAHTCPICTGRLEAMKNGGAA